MQYPNVTKIAKKLGTPIVAFDLEHSGGKKEVRGITDFGAVVVLPSGALMQYNSLVKPLPGTQFNPVVTRLTGITEQSLELAPSWAQVYSDFVAQYQNSVWVGFNSKSCDMPIMLAESEKFGLQLTVREHLDLMRLGTLKGTLSHRLSQLVSDFDITGAHRGLKDAIMTLTLFENLLPSLVDTELAYFVKGPEAPTIPLALNLGTVSIPPTAEKKSHCAQEACST